MKTVAQLKRDANAGVLEARMLVRCGVPVEIEGIPDRLSGFRKIAKANTKSLLFENPGGNNEYSFLDIPKSNLVEYDDDSLTLYFAGYRKPDASEQAILDEWKKHEQTSEYQERSWNDAMTDSSSTYWEKKLFFEKRNAKYLTGLEKQRGMILDFNESNERGEPIIRDDKVKGDIAMKYELRRIK